MLNRTDLGIKRRIERIQSGQFITDDIELLLINIREYARLNNFFLLLEFSDFIAHPKRDKGILYSQIDVMYSQFKYIPSSVTGDRLNYNSIPKDIVDILVNKAIDLLDDNFLINEFGKNAVQLKSQILNSVLKKNGGNYAVTGPQALSEFKDFQRITAKTPIQKAPLTANKFMDEVFICVQSLASENNLVLKADRFKKIIPYVLLHILEIVQDCQFELHDQTFANGWITVNGDNRLYHSTKKREHLTISLSANTPIGVGQMIFDVLQTGFTIGHLIPKPNELISWFDEDKSSGRLNRFRVNTEKKLVLDA